MAAAVVWTCCLILNWLCVLACALSAAEQEVCSIQPQNCDANRAFSSLVQLNSRAFHLKQLSSFPQMPPMPIQMSVANRLAKHDTLNTVPVPPSELLPYDDQLLRLQNEVELRNALRDWSYSSPQLKDEAVPVSGISLHAEVAPLAPIRGPFVPGLDDHTGHADTMRSLLDFSFKEPFDPSEHGTDHENEVEGIKGKGMEHPGTQHGGAAIMESIHEAFSPDQISLAGEGEVFQWWLFYIMSFLFFAMLFMAVPFVGLGTNLHCATNFLGSSIRAAIHRLDKTLLGVQVNVGHLSLNLFDGYLDCDHLTVYNPPGYSSQYLMQATKVLVDVDIGQMVTSCMNKVSVDKLVFKGVTANYERKWGTSNMQEVLQFIEEKTAQLNLLKSKDSKKSMPSSQAASSKSSFELHRVDVQNILVNVRPSGGIGDYMNFEMEAADVYYQDFDKEVGYTIIDDIVKELLRSLLKTVISNVAGKQALPDYVA